MKTTYKKLLIKPQFRHKRQFMPTSRSSGLNKKLMYTMTSFMINFSKPLQPTMSVTYNWLWVKITQPFFKKKNQSSKLNNVKSISLNEKKSLVSTIYFWWYRLYKRRFIAMLIRNMLEFVVKFFLWTLI